VVVRALLVGGMGFTRHKTKTSSLKETKKSLRHFRRKSDTKQKESSGNGNESIKRIFFGSEFGSISGQVAASLPGLKLVKYVQRVLMNRTGELHSGKRPPPSHRSTDIPFVVDHVEAATTLANTAARPPSPSRPPCPSGDWAPGASAPPPPSSPE